MSKKLIGMILVAVLVFAVVPVQADSITENLGVGSNVWLEAQNGANNATNLYVGKDMFAQIGSKRASMDLHSMMNGNVYAGRGGIAVLEVDNMNVGNQYVGPEVIVQNLASHLDLYTLATNNGSSVVSTALCVGETASEPGKLAVDQLVVVAFSASTTMPSYCGPGGTATSNVGVNVRESQTVIGGGCQPNPCQ